MNKNKELFDFCTDCLTKEFPVLRKWLILHRRIWVNTGGSRQTITNIESGTSKMKWSIF